MSEQLIEPRRAGCRLAAPFRALLSTRSPDAEAAALAAGEGRTVSQYLRFYRREALRLLLWLGEQRLALAELKVEHVHLYYAHLANPPKHWIRPRKPRRDETLLPTQALAGPLSNKSIDYTRTVLGQMCSTCKTRATCSATYSASR